MEGWISVPDLIPQGQKVVADPQTVHGSRKQLHQVAHELTLSVSARVRDSKSYLDRKPRGVYRTEDFTTRKAKRNRHTTAVRSRSMPLDALCPSAVRPVKFRKRCQGPGNSTLNVWTVEPSISGARWRRRSEISNRGGGVSCSIPQRLNGF